MMSTTHKVTSGDAELHARVDGADHLPWLLLSNSLATDLSLWEDQMAVLTRTHRVLRYDTRGHGQSSAPAGPYSFDLLVGDMVALMDHFGIARADILGLSLGGMTALGLGLDHPARVGRLICADARADNPPAFIEGWDHRIAIVREKGMAGIVGGTMERWFTATGRERRPEMVEHASRMMLATSADGYIASAQALKKLDYLRRLPQMKAQTLYIVGAEDGAAPPDAVRAMAAATPGARFEMIPGAAHIANIEDTEAFNALVTGFLGAERQAAE